uniref:Uncharacterized protein n=1 Tax=Meloidogyne enterolobii TaxID=390850 RepID=A0A6V7XGJ7_MELEN|nr:unnamed protein product [Meloidogyne enterolobii]
MSIICYDCSLYLDYSALCAGSLQTNPEHQYGHPVIQYPFDQTHQSQYDPNYGIINPHQFGYGNPQQYSDHRNLIYLIFPKF